MRVALIRGARLLGLGAVVVVVLAIAPLGGAVRESVAAPAVAEVGALATVANTGIQIQNLSATSPAAVVLEFYSQTGPTYTVSIDPIPAGGNTTVYLPNLSSPPGPPSGFVGSVVVSSDQPIAAIAKTNWSDKASAAYTGFLSGSSEFFMPLLLHSYNNQNSRITVQNTGTAPANVSVEIFESGQASPKVTETHTIPAGASYTWDQGTATNLGDKFIGSARIVATGSTVAAVGEVFRPGSSVNAVYSYNGFASGGTRLVAALARRNWSSTTTGIQVQNVGNSTTLVTVTYKGKYRSTSGTMVDYTGEESYSLAAKASVNFFNGGNFKGQATGLPDQFLGAATITSSGGVPLVAMVNDLVSATGSSAAYNALPQSEATTKVVVPLVRNFHTANLMTTGVQVANVGTAPANVTITYVKSPSYSGSLSAEQTTDTAQIPVGASQTFYQGGGYVKSSSIKLPTGFLGSATITSDQPILAIVNDISKTAPPAYDASIFNGINQ